jgi:O-antigen/teichoic acid export membrane protein
MELIYGGAEFNQSADIARILLIGGLSNGFTSVMGQVLWAGDREVSALRIAATNAATKILLTWVLAARFGLYGAAWAGALAAVLNVIQHYVPILRSDGSLHVFRRTVRPWLAAAGMAAVVASTGGMVLPVAVSLGVVVYIVLLVALYLVTDARRFRPWFLNRVWPSR